MIFGSLFGGGSNKPRYRTTRDFEELMGYGLNNNRFFDDKNRADDYLDSLYDSLDQGTIDKQGALADANTRIRPGSGFDERDAYARIRDYQLGAGTQGGIADYAIEQALGFGYGDLSATKEKLLSQAAAMGKTGSRRELSSFLARTLANDPRARLRAAPSLFERQREADYGRMAVNDKGEKIGYRIFGDDKQAMQRFKSATQNVYNFMNNFSASMGARGSIG